MAVIKEFKCAKHGSFVGSHPICPKLGCMSESVEREFLTPVGISKGRYNRFDQGLRKTSEMMSISNWKTARAGESSFAGRGQDAPIGTEVLWGTEIQKKMGMSMPQLTTAAASTLPQVEERIARAQGADAAARDPYVKKHNGMRAAATTLGVTQHTLPPAEITAQRGDKGLAA